MNLRVGIDCRMLDRSGIGRYVRNLVSRLDRRSTLLFRSRPAEVDEPGLRDFESRWLRSGVFSVREQWELPRTIAGAGLHVFHSPQFNVPLCSRPAQVTTIYDCTLDRFPANLPSRPARVYYRAMMFATTRRSRAILVPSQATKNDLIKFHKAPEEKIHLIPLGVDLEQFRRWPEDDPRRADVARRFGAGEPTVLYVGLNHPHKNLRRLMQALRIVRQGGASQWKGLRLVCVGPLTPRFPSPAELAAVEGQGDAVLQVGAVADDQLVGLLSIVMALILPSTWEGFGLPILEAMACGVPVLASSVAALRETAGDAAEYFDPLEPEDLADRLVSLLENESRREELVQKGNGRVRLFSWDSSVRATLEVYGSAAIAGT